MNIPFCTSKSTTFLGFVHLRPQAVSFCCSSRAGGVWPTIGIHCAEPSAQQRERGHNGIHLLWRDFVAAGSNWLSFVSLIPCPIFNMQAIYPNEFIFVIGNNCCIMGQSNCRYHEIQRTDWRSFAFKISSNSSIAFCSFCIEV